MRALLFIILVGSSISCLRATEFKCNSAGDCTGEGGACELTGYCSYPDTTCTTGRRYGDFAGQFTKECVGEVMPGIDAGPGDGNMGDVPPTGCPADYMTLPNAGTHRYRVRPAASWSMQRDACASDGGYLAIPDNDAELTAIAAAAAAARTWVGINDIDNEGQFVTVKGGAASYLPWAGGEPDDVMGGQDCVSGIMASPNIATDKCSDMMLAVCECEP